MDITFDPVKNAKNRTKHGVSLALAAEMDWESALIWSDERIDYGEDRECALLLHGTRLFFVAFVDRDGKRRVISARKANKREVERYVSQI